MTWRLMLLSGLVAACMGSALAVVFIKHESRSLFMALQAETERRDALNVEWGQLQLEQSTWATHGRIEAFAVNRLGMRMPDRTNTVIVLEQ